MPRPFMISGLGRTPEQSDDKVLANRSLQSRMACAADRGHWFVEFFPLASLGALPSLPWLTLASALPGLIFLIFSIFFIHPELTGARADLFSSLQAPPTCSRAGPMMAGGKAPAGGWRAAVEATPEVRTARMFPLFIPERFTFDDNLVISIH